MPEWKCSNLSKWWPNNERRRKTSPRQSTRSIWNRLRSRRKRDRQRESPSNYGRWTGMSLTVKQLHDNAQSFGEGREVIRRLPNGEVMIRWTSALYAAYQHKIKTANTSQAATQTFPKPTKESKNYHETRILHRPKPDLYLPDRGRARAPAHKWPPQRPRNLPTRGADQMKQNFDSSVSLQLNSILEGEKTEGQQQSENSGSREADGPNSRSPPKNLAAFYNGFNSKRRYVWTRT